MDNNKGVANNPKPITRRAWEENSNSTPKTGEYAGKKVTEHSSDKTLTPANKNTSEHRTKDTQITQRTVKHKDNTTTGNQSASDLEDKESLDNDWYITDIDSDISLEPSSGDKWELNGSLLDDETSKEDMNDKWKRPASFHDNTPEKTTINNQSLHDDIINSERSKLKFRPHSNNRRTSEHRADEKKFQEYVLAANEKKLKNFTPPPYMALHQQLTTLTT